MPQHDRTYTPEDATSLPRESRAGRALVEHCQARRVMRWWTSASVPFIWQFASHLTGILPSVRSYRDRLSALLFTKHMQVCTRGLDLGKLDHDYRMHEWKPLLLRIWQQPALSRFCSLFCCSNHFVPDLIEISNSLVTNISLEVPISMRCSASRSITRAPWHRVPHRVAESCLHLEILVPTFRPKYGAFVHNRRRYSAKQNLENEVESEMGDGGWAIIKGVVGNRLIPSMADYLFNGSMIQVSTIREEAQA